MLSRIIYSLKSFWSYRAELKHYLQDSKLRLAQVIDLKPADLGARGVVTLALDFDGVLASHAETTLGADTLTWLHNFAQQFAPHKIYILSNKPTPERQAYFKQHFPEIVFIMAKRKKPYPDGLQQIMLAAGLQPRQVLLVDDRLGTGILAAIISGAQAYFITRPMVNFYARPIREAWFMLLRRLECFACKMI